MLAELAFDLFQSGLFTDAVRIFDEIGIGQLPAGSLPVYVEALTLANDLVRAQLVIDQIAETGELPDWALDIATRIAFRKEDKDLAVDCLAQLVQRGSATSAARLELAYQLIEKGRTVDGIAHIDHFLKSDDASAIKKMQAAQLLQRAGQEDRALPIAFRAFRDAQEDPRLHRAFAILVLNRKGDLEAPVEVGPNTHVRLRNQDGEVLERTVYADGPVATSRSEQSTSEAECFGSLGKRVGDEIVINKGKWTEKRWVVEEILHAIGYAFQDVLNNYEERFPSEPFFVTRFSLGDETSVKFLAPMIGSADDRKQSIETAFQVYKEKNLPLGFVANLISVSIQDVMEEACTKLEMAGPLFVEWSDVQGQQQSRSACLATRKVVLTQSALGSARKLELLPLIADCYEVLVPSSLREELKEQLEEAKRELVEGRKCISAGGPGLELSDIQVGAPVLTQRVDAIQSELGWLETAASLEPRPLATIKPIGSREEEARDIVGHSSIDAVALSNHTGAALYADDLGLRRVLSARGSSAPSFSTVSLLSALEISGKLDTTSRLEALLDLVLRNFVFVMPERDLLIQALRRPEPFCYTDQLKVFSLLASPMMSAPSAARIAGEVLRWAATVSIQTLTIEYVAGLILSAMAQKWPSPLCSRLVGQAAENTLALLPQENSLVKRVCEGFARGEPVVLPKIDELGTA